jgi:hypothetical protein
LNATVGNTHLSNEGSKTAPLCFIKPPQPSLDWQKVLPKKERNNKVKEASPKGKEVRACFKYLQPGHINQECKEQIKCFYCRNSGHTVAQCKARTLFKKKETQTTTHTTAPILKRNHTKGKQWTQPHTKVQELSTVAMDHDFHAERPEQRELFLPE